MHARCVILDDNDDNGMYPRSRRKVDVRMMSPVRALRSLLDRFLDSNPPLARIRALSALYCFGTVNSCLVRAIRDHLPYREQKTIFLAGSPNFRYEANLVRVPIEGFG